MTGKFTFATREEGFDNHIALSIRGYEDLWNDVLKISEYFIESDTCVYDIGCSTGKLLHEMLKRNHFASKVRYEGIEIEREFFSEWQKIEHNILHDQNPNKIKRNEESTIHFSCEDVRDSLIINASFITSIFTLQFMPRHHRKDIIKEFYEALLPGGGFVFAEKTVSPSSRINDIRNFTYYDFKHTNFSYDDIMKKEQELRHMLRPNTQEELLDMCRVAGFKQIDSFWQNHSFIGFIAIK